MKTNIFYVSGTVFQKAECQADIHCEDGIPKYCEVYNILSASLSCQQSTPHFPSYTNLPGPSAPNHIYLNPSSPVLKFLPEHITIL